MRFLLSRRWLLFALAVGVLAYCAVWLAEWQFGRLAERERGNAIVSENLTEPPVPVTTLMEVGAAPPEDQQWRRVVARGEYDASGTVILRYQTRDGESGVDLVTPLVTREGPAVLVDRGWLRTRNTGDISDVDLPAPPDGEVTVVGWVRRDATGDATRVTEGSARAVSSVAIGATLPYPVYAGFLDAESETPPPATTLVPPELPDLGEGPHFFYGLQWWFFGALAVFGFGYLAYDERRRIATGAAGRDRSRRGAPRRTPGGRDTPLTASVSSRRPRGPSHQ